MNCRRCPTATMHLPTPIRDSRDPSIAQPTGVMHPPVNTLERLHCCAASLSAYIFNRVLMYIPSRHLRTFLFRLKVAEVGKGVCLLMGIEVRNGRNVFLGDRVVVNRRVLLDGRGGRL